MKEGIGTDGMAGNDHYRMTVDLNVLDHLGINLYSNIAAVLTEAVANAWDADAENVEIGIDPDGKFIEIKDGGIDVRGTLVVGDVVRIKMAVQVKKWKLKNNILAPVVQQVRGSLGAHEQGLIITTSDFSAGAIKEAAQPDKTPIALMNGEQLVMLLMEHGIGVHRSTPDLFEIDEEFAMGGNVK